MLLVAGAVAAFGLASIERSAGSGAALGLASLAAAAPPLVALALVGRSLLAWLPAGLPGRHAPRALVATWAASHVLGLAALELTSALLALVRIEPTATSLLVPWAVVLAARVLSLPGALVPRHELPGERARAPHRVASLAIGFAALALVGHVAGSAADAAAPAILPALLGARASAWLPAVSWLAAAALVAHGLERSRRAPPLRRLVVALFVLTPSGLAACAEQRVDALVALAFGAGCAGLVAWLRRADRRALALGLLSFGTCALVQREALPLALAGLAATVAATAAPARALAAKSALGVGAACCAAAFAGCADAGAGAGELPLLDALLSPARAGAWTVALVLALVVARRERRPWGRDRAGLALALALALPAELARVLQAPAAVEGLPLVPAVALLAGSLLAGRERDEPTF